MPEPATDLPERTDRPRRLTKPRLVAMATLVLLVGAAPFVPRGGGEHGSLRDSGSRVVPTYDARPAATAGFGRVTPAMAAEIDRVVRAGNTLNPPPAAHFSPQARVAARLATTTGARALARSVVRCAVFAGQRYCLGTGWTEDTAAQVQARVATSAERAASRRTTFSTAPASPTRTGTGDLTAVAELSREATLSPGAREAHDRAELTMAARSVAKVWLLRHEIEGVPLPTGFLAAHPEARAATVTTASPAAFPTAAATASTKPSTTPTATATPTTTVTPTATATVGSPSPTGTATTTHTGTPTTTQTTTASTTATPTATPSPIKSAADYPRRDQVLDPADTAEQVRTYWCGPTAMQMIAWGWLHTDLGAQHWADQLGTTSGGTSITDMVRVVNQDTGWDNKKYAGPYIVLDISHYSFKEWDLLLMRHITDYHAPVILHPILLKKYYPYLDHDESGHFQAGRGYDQNGKKPDLIGYFEPWNQQRFNPSLPYIARVQWRDAYKSYRANEEHFQHDIGV